MESANEITRYLLGEIPKTFDPHVRVWRNNRVVAKAIGSGGRTRQVDAGINGQADISGIVGPGGIRIEIEVKSGRDVQSLSQKAFQKMIEDRGGWYLIARNGADCIAELQERISGTQDDYRGERAGPLRPDI